MRSAKPHTAEEPSEQVDLASIDRPLAVSEMGWDVEAELTSLRESADEQLPRPALPPRPKHPTVPQPAPQDLAPGWSGPAAVAMPSKAPPLPTRASQPPPPPQLRKGPPPLPPRADAGAGPRRDSIPAPAVRRIDTSLVDLLAARITALDADGQTDTVGLARTHIEMAVACEGILADDARAMAHAESALRVNPRMAAGHAILRRKRHGRPALAAMLEHLENELAAATDDGAIVELLVEKARLMEARADEPDLVREVWQQALARAPRHAAALKGLEGELTLRAYSDRGAEGEPPSHLRSYEALAVHFGRMADAYMAQPNLAAWLHAERAHLLEWRLGRVEEARGSLERAVQLDPAVGPVRRACVRHVSAHGDAGALAALLEEEASIETDAHRAARLELDASQIVAHRLEDIPRAIDLLTRAARRAPTTPTVDRAVLDGLVRLEEQLADWTMASRARRARLPFIRDPQLLAHELRMLARIGERIGDLPAAIGDIARALDIEPHDGTLLDTMDRLLAAAKRDEDRISLWVNEAARLQDGPRRARALGRAAHIAETALLRPNDAIRHLRAGWVAAPGDAETFDALSRLMAPAPAETLDREARALIDLYTHAATTTHDRGRRVAYLEKIAVLWEELIGDPRRAIKAYQEILRLEPDRRGAVLGLGRTAAKVSDDRALAQALLDEARLAEDGVDVLTLRVRAAAALARVDGPRALSLVEEVLQQDTAHATARALETRLHEEAGRWDRAATSLRTRIEHTVTTHEKVTLWLALAQVQELRLRDHRGALLSLQAARVLDPKHPVPPEEIPRMLDGIGDHPTLRGALESLADTAEDLEERVRYLLRAAEIDELCLLNDERAAATYAKALVLAPDEELIAERLERVLARRVSRASSMEASAAHLRDLSSLQAQRLERSHVPDQRRVLAFDLAALLVEQGRDLRRATELLETVLDEEGTHAPALRLLEHVARRLDDVERLARALSRQGSSLLDLCARLGSLWALAALEEWRLPSADSGETYARILELDPTDPSALEATVRRQLSHARRGDTSARKAVLGALRSLHATASDVGTRLAIQLRLALLLEESASETSESTGAMLVREALERYRATLHMDDLSVSGAVGLARTATRLRDVDGAFASASSLAELCRAPKARARYLHEAAELLLGPQDADSLDAKSEVRLRGCLLLERALEADPDALGAAMRLATVRQQGNEPERIIDPFDRALGEAHIPEALVFYGTELARVARDVLEDLPLGIESMRRVRARVPGHVGALLVLAELCMRQGSWPETVDALEEVVTAGRDVRPRLAALFALASIQEHVLGRPEAAERALRTAMGIEGNNERVIRGLLRHIHGFHAGAGGELGQEDRQEIAELLERLTHVEREPLRRTELLLELADARARLNDGAAVERALIEAVAQSPGVKKAFARLAAFYATTSGTDHAAYARALNGVISRGQQLGQVDARWYSTLGRIEIESINRLRDGIGHLLQATQIDPALYEVRFELARAYARAQANDEVARQLLSMVVAPVAGGGADSAPLCSLSDPAAALALLENALLGTERRSEEALVVSELRAVAGDLDDARHLWLRQRRLPAGDHASTLDRPALVTYVLPQEGRHVLLEVAAAVAGIESRILRAELSEIGISPRDRVSARSGHPTRTILDRLARALGLTDLELVVTSTVNRTRVLAQDTLWIVVPRALCEQPEPTQMAALARALTRVSLGVPWLEELPPPHIEALLIACARQVVHGYAADDVDVLSSKLVAQYEPNVARTITRKHKKLLDELAPHIMAPQGRPIPVETFIRALARAEVRAAFVLSGDLLATIDDLRAMDAVLFHSTERPSVGSLRAVLEHEFAGDLCRFAFSQEAMSLRRSIGTLWGS